MPINDTLQLIGYASALIVLCPLLGRYLYLALLGEHTGLHTLLSPLEQASYRICGIDPHREQDWKQYAGAMLLTNLAGFLLLFAILLLQHRLPLNPQHLPGLSWDLAFNTAISFTTNTNWQSYSGETTMSYLSQMLGLTTQNFLSAATGIAVLLAMIRGFVRKQTSAVGNFYVDAIRVLLYVLLPMAMIFALVLLWQGVPQNLSAYTEALTLEGAHQTIAQGPVASQEAIKMIGTNGGGFFNANSAHPYENPTPLSNFLQMLSIFSLGGALVFLFGDMVGDRRQAWAIFWVMFIPFAIAVGLLYAAESQGSVFAQALGAEATNMEGKEVRFGILNSTLFAAITTAASCGAVNAMHDSFTAFGGLVPLVMMQLGEVIFGGVGSGLYGMLTFALLTVFIAGLMVGRTPEYLGKKIEAKEVKLAVIAALLTMPAGVLLIGGIAIALPQGVASIQEAGPHGLSELLYAYTSATANNGSAFAGFNANTPLHNLLLGACMVMGRFAPMVLVLAIAGSLASKKTVPPSAGTFPTHGGLFVALLIGVILIVGALTFFPVLALGPLAEHFSLSTLGPL